MSVKRTSVSEISANDKRGNRLLMVPNILCFIRLIGSAPLIWIALEGRSQMFLWLFVFLAMTDWIDGKLAILLNQRSVFGARLDSFADAALYFALFCGSLILHWSVLSRELWWVLPAAGTYLFSTIFGFSKFGRWPSYHTRMAKTSWLLVLVGAVCFLSNWTIWPLRTAMIAVSVTNLEAILITYFLTEWQTDVSSLYVTLKNRPNG